MAIHGEIKGDKLILTIDISQAARDAAPPSSSNKNLLVASSRGTMRFGDVGVLLNCTIPIPHKV